MKIGFIGAGKMAQALGDSQIVQDLLSTVGYAVELPEIHIDPVTGLSGSGPSYGLPRDLSMKLAAMTLYGAAKMFLETGEHPAILKEAIQSPGGSTIFGMHELEKGGLRGLLINAVEAGAERSRHMGQTSLQHNRTKSKRKEEKEEFSDEETSSESDEENSDDDEEDELKNNTNGNKGSDKSLKKRIKTKDVENI
uniref:Pyrroline-5-carboxylate reductase n=1 Tax=Meloidogyne hapla TaxID=6305 RepID=A0A1I8BK47_MELHA